MTESTCKARRSVLLMAGSRSERGAALWSYATIWKYLRCPSSYEVAFAVAASTRPRMRWRIDLGSVGQTRRSSCSSVGGASGAAHFAALAFWKSRNLLVSSSVTSFGSGSARPNCCASLPPQGIAFVLHTPANIGDRVGAFSAWGCLWAVAFGSESQALITSATIQMYTRNGRDNPCGILGDFGGIRVYCILLFGHSAEAEESKERF